MPKIIMLELTPEIMMKAIETLAEMLVSVKDHPALIKAIPSDPQTLTIVVLQQTAAHFERVNGVTPHEDAVSTEQLEQLVKAFQEAMAKAQSK